MSEDDSDPTRRVSRRLVLTATASAVGVSLAGCMGGDGGGEATTTTEETTTEATTTTTTTEQVSLEESAEVPEDARCAVCNMMAAKYPEWNAQLTLDVDDGQRAHFCSPGCMTAFYADPGHFVDGTSQDDIVGVWARDYDSKELVDATSANWVLELMADRIDAPMMRNPLAFESADAAQSYVDEYDDLTKHDVVGLAAFDVPLGRYFRAKFLPETEEPSVLDAAEVPDDAECAVCGMMPAKFPDANAQLSFEGGERAYFCSPGCMTAYYGVPSHFHEERAQDDIVGVWAHDYGTKEQIDAVQASYVLEMTGEGIDLPMMKNPVPFAKSEDAVAFAEDHDLTEEDVIGLLSFDEELAKKYRMKQFS